MDMYADDLVSREELNVKLGNMKNEAARLEAELKMMACNMNKGDQLEAIIQRTFRSIEGITSVREMTNEQLKQIVRMMEVDKEGNINIYLRLFGELGLDDTITINHNHACGCFGKVWTEHDKPLSCLVCYNHITVTV